MQVNLIRPYGGFHHDLSPLLASSGGPGWCCIGSMYRLGGPSVISYGYCMMIIFSVAMAFSAGDYPDYGSISIDCGSEASYNYSERLYQTDEGFIDTGSNRRIPTSGNKSQNNLPPQVKTARVFTPDVKRNCYVLNLKQGSNKNTKYLIRALFRYGNYDGKNSPPEFDLYVGVNRWKRVKVDDPWPDYYEYHEIIYDFPVDTFSVDVCLVDIERGIPVISALELRLVEKSIYSATDSGPALSIAYRYDMGYGSGEMLNANGKGYFYSNPKDEGKILASTRYEDDPYDRIWSQYKADTVRYWWFCNNTITDYTYNVPQRVLQTISSARDITECIDVAWKLSNETSAVDFYVYFHFAEISKTLAGTQHEDRQLTINLNDKITLDAGPITLLFLQTVTKPYPIPASDTLDENKLSVCTTPGNNVTAMVNAVEIFELVHLPNAPTHSEDVGAMKDIKRSYEVERNWQGDPCLPREFLWNGLACRNADNITRITSLSLRSSNLTGDIVASFFNLKSLELLDLSDNHLTGRIPEFIAQLPSLKFLNLTGNNLEGSIPAAVMLKVNAGSLNLSADENPKLCWPSPCRKKLTVVIISSTASATAVILSLLVAVASWWKCKHKRRAWIQRLSLLRRGVKQMSLLAYLHDSKDEGCGGWRKESINPKIPEFSYSRVVSVTNNFRTIIGQGGFGKVYFGTLEDGTSVAAKLLSPSSKQGAKEFHNEANVLMKVYHGNLVSLIGYCNDGKHIVLIYEYMPNGDLMRRLSDTSTEALDWNRRLCIARDAGQGLEYLHNGCKPPIIHRDTKSSNILLDQNWNAKIADFGLSRDSKISQTTEVAGTIAYMDPEYFSIGKLNMKSDVYSFGVVLLELITGKSAVVVEDDLESPEPEKIHLINWTTPLIEIGDIHSIVDSRLKGDFKPNAAWKAVEVAMSCVSPSSRRPEMGQVVAELKECLAIEMEYPQENSNNSLV